MIWQVVYASECTTSLAVSEGFDLEDFCKSSWYWDSKNWYSSLDLERSYERFKFCAWKFCDDYRSKVNLSF